MLLDEFRFDYEFRERNDRVPAHRAVALVVQEEHIEVGVG